MPQPSKQPPNAARSQGIERLRDTLLALENFRQVMASRLNLNTSDLGALSFIRSTSQIGQTELADYLGLSTSAITTLIDRLESRGLVERTPHQTDRRRTVLGLTPRGGDLLDRVRNRYIDALTSVPAEHLDAANAALSAIAANLANTE